LTRDQLFEKLRANGIYSRRYFYPLISDFPMYRGLTSASPSNLPVARKAASEVICLPIYPNLDSEEVDSIIKVINDFSKDVI
jgi:dTDP-4-amino-4,6-dideoxygalactose transaminase